MPLTPILSFWLALVAPAWAGGAPNLVCPKCNVIVIAIDTLRPDHLGCYGYAKPTSPNIDRIARSGVVFDRFMAQGYLTPVSMASMFTSRYPTSNGYTNFVSVVDTATPMLPEVLRTFGFKTAAFLTSPEFYVRPWGPGVEPRASFDRGFDLYQYPAKTTFDVAASTTPKFRDVPGPEVLDWLARSRESHFFLWLALGSTHWPYGFAAPDQTKRLFSASYRGPLDPDRINWWNTLGVIYDGYLYPFPGARPVVEPRRLTQEDRDMIISRYDSGVRHSDEFVGKIWAQLQKLGLDRKTIVVILAEHAEDLGEHGYYSHYDIHNTELRIPMILSHPGLSGGRRDGGLASGLDLAPTILDMVGITPFHQAQGRSLVPRLEGKDADPDDGEVFSERTPPWELVLYQRVFSLVPASLAEWSKSYAATLAPLAKIWTPESADISVQTSRWKLIHRRSRELLERFSWWSYVSGRRISVPAYELYDLSSDPLESRNLYDSMPAAAAPLKRRLADFEAREDLKVRAGGRQKVVAYPYP